VTTFALVHGAYGRGAYWAPLVAELEARGHRALAPDLPIEDRDATFDDYAEAVGPCDHVVGHSMGGVTAALVAGRRGVPVTYVAAVVPRPGRPLTEVLSEAIAPEVVAAEVRGEDGLRRLPPGCLGPDLELRGQSVTPYFEPFPLAAVPGGRYVLCRHDDVVRPAYARAAAPGDLVELACGHYPMLECPVALAEVLLA
jgi:pimeloyl-ACP methyl ester carboxylesterase